MQSIYVSITLGKNSPKWQQTTARVVYVYFNLNN